jgi:tetratricopeptide (TPR) repeat protein
MNNDEDNKTTKEPFKTLKIEDFLVLNGDEVISDDEAEARERKASDWFLLGARAYIHDELEVAITYFDKVLELEPKNDRAYANRADVHCDQGNYQEAHSDYMMAAHLGGVPAKELLADFIAQMQEKNLMDDSGNFVKGASKETAESSYWQKVSEDELGEDMHIVDLKSYHQQADQLDDDEECT